jgi:hypothetical protein
MEGEKKMAKGGGLYPSRNFAGLSGTLKDHHLNIQALFSRYHHSPPESRPAIVQEILLRLHSHLAMERTVYVVVRNSWSYDMELVEDVIQEHEHILRMFNQLVKSENEDEEVWEEMFEDLMQNASVHFIREERDLLPLVDRSCDA